MSPDLELAIKIVLLMLAVLGAGVALGKWLWRGGETKHEITSSITALGTKLETQIAGISSRLERHEKAREEEAKERAIERAAEQRRQVEEAVRRAQAEERERSYQAAVSELRDDVDGLNERVGAHHDRLRDVERKLSSPTLPAHRGGSGAGE